jgi:hypothetical protein
LQVEQDRLQESRIGFRMSRIGCKMSRIGCRTSRTCYRRAVTICIISSIS